MTMGDEDLLIVADPARCADLRYAVNLCRGVPLAFLRLGGRRHVLVPRGEVELARRQLPDCRVSPLGNGAGAPHPDAQVWCEGLAGSIKRLVREQGAGRLLVPRGFPLGLARELRRQRVRLKPVARDPFFVERAVKSTTEVGRIRAALVMAEVGLAEAIQALKSSKIGPRGQLIYRGTGLTAGRLGSIVRVAVLQAGGETQRGQFLVGTLEWPEGAGETAVLRANQPIMLALVPCSEKTGYHGGLARTVVRGRAGETVRRLYATVLRGQAVAFEQLRAGVCAGDVHATVRECLEREGFASFEGRGRTRGFIQGTGHGMGLEVREPPYLVARSPAVLAAGNVIALGPGLYYPELGGVRVDDLALLTRNGARNLTQFEKVLEV